MKCAYRAHGWKLLDNEVQLFFGGAEVNGCAGIEHTYQRLDHHLRVFLS